MLIWDLILQHFLMQVTNPYGPDSAILVHVEQYLMPQRVPLHLRALLVASGSETTNPIYFNRTLPKDKV